MRLAFVTPRFGAADATPAELLAAELARRAPGHWRTTVLTTTARGSAGEPFPEGQFQEERARIHRFAAEGPPSAEDAASPALLAHLAERSADHDLVVLFGARPALCREAARLDPARTVLLPFADDSESGYPPPGDAFEHPAAFLFESEAEEMRVLKRYGVHRRMRETVGGTLLLPRAADPAAFRRRFGLTGRHLALPGPLENGRGIEEFLRFFATFRDRHPEAPLELVLFGPAAIDVPRRPGFRVFDPRGAGERRNALAGALMVVLPERLAGFAAAAEPFSLGAPILVNASATELVGDCKASNGGLYYRNYEELELILELGLRDPPLFGRMGAAGREFLMRRNDWDALMARYDRAFRSFARPSRAGAPSGPATGAPRPRRQGAAAPGEASPPPEGAEPSAAPPREDADRAAPEADPQSPDDPPLAAEGAAAGDATGDRAAEPELREEPAPGEAESAEPESEGSEPDGSEADGAGDGSLPSFFQGSIRG